MSDELVGRIDHERHLFIARDGTEVQLQPISPFMLERLYNDRSGEPKVPKVTVVIAGKYERKEPNPNDPAYIEAHTAWESARNVRIARFCITHGVSSDPPETFIDEYQTYFPDTPVTELRYLWVVDLLGDIKEEWELFVEAVLGQTIATEKGIEQAENSFPGDSERLAG